MGRETFSVESYVAARRKYDVEAKTDITRRAEHQAQTTGSLNEIVDPAINPIRRSLIRLDPHQKKWVATIGCPMDIEVSCDTTGSMGGEVDTEMAVLPDLYAAVSKVLPGYDPQLCLGIFGDAAHDQFGLCRPQFEMEAPKIVNYLKEMAPCRDGGDGPEDPQYSMFARAYLTDAYTNRIGLKGYHFIVTDSVCHRHVNRREIQSIFGAHIFENELKDMQTIPDLEEVIQDLKKKAHQFILVVHEDYSASFWRDLCGAGSVIQISSTQQLPAVISAIIGLTEGTLDPADVKSHLQDMIITSAVNGLVNGTISHTDPSRSLSSLVDELLEIDIGAQEKLRHELPHPVPKAGDIFVQKTDLWPIQPDEESGETEEESSDASDATAVEYL